MKNKDTVLLENIYSQLLNTRLNEMAFGLGVGGVQKNIKEIMDLFIQKDSESSNRVIPFSFTSVTTPRIRKTGFPYKTLYKITQTVAQITDYEKEVNRQLVKQGEEGDFKGGSSSVLSERLSRSVGITKKGLPVLILDITYVKSATSLFVVREQSGELHYVDKEEANQYLIPSTPSPQGTAVKWRNYGFDKLVGVRVDNQEIVNSEIDPDKIQVFEYVKDKLKS